MAKLTGVTPEIGAWAEVIDLELDLANRMIYWTDRGDPPRGNTVNRARMDDTPANRKDPEIVSSGPHF